MKVFSGNVMLCETGLVTPFKDATGDTLYTGDIVITFTDSFWPEQLTVVVQDQLCIFGNNSDNFFVMGIAKVPLHDPEQNEWKVKRLKLHSDVIVGEHWEAWGFNYRD